MKSNGSLKTIYICFTVLYLYGIYIILLCPGILEARTVSVGIYQNPPKVFVEDGKAPSGIFVDIMNEIARRENWDLNYVYGTWDDNLDRLNNEELDIILDVTWHKDRIKNMDFNTISVVESWLQAFTTDEKLFESVYDLNNKTIAVLKESIQEHYLLHELPAWFPLNYTVLSYPDYPATIKALTGDKVDLIVADRFFYFSSQRPSDVKPTPIILNPMGIFFAFSNGDPKQLIPIVDKHITSMKNNPESVYYKTINYWLNIPSKKNLSKFVSPVLMTSGSLFLIFLLFILLLKKQVRNKTQELQDSKNTLMHMNEELGKLYQKEIVREKEISQRLKEKEVLLKEVHHRVKNNLNVISSMMKIQMRRVSGKNDAIKACQNISDRIKSMALIHESIYASENLDNINMKQYVSKLANQLKQTYVGNNRIVISSEIENIMLNIDKAVPCGLMLNELITNALKHAFPHNQNGVIIIKFHRTDDSFLELSVIDNGVGLPENFNEDESETLGFHLIRILTDQINGTLSVLRENGTRINIHFPVM